MHNKFKNLSVRFRLLAFTALLLLLLVITGSGGLLGMRQANNSFSAVYNEKVMPLSQLRELDNTFQSGIFTLVDRMAYQRIPWDQGAGELLINIERTEQLWADMLAVAGEQPRGGQDWFSAGRELMGKSSEATRELKAIIRERNTAGLAAFHTNRLHELAAAYKETIDALVHNRLESVNGSFRNFQEEFAFSKIAFSLTLLVALIASLAAGLMLIGSINAPLSKMIAGMKEVTKGDLTQRISYDRKDEFGVVTTGFNQMITFLAELVTQVQRSGIQVTSSITELASTNRQQEVTANEHAATASEIAASTTEITATGANLLQTMKRVNSLTRNAAFAAEEGHSGVQNIDRTMKKMEEATGAIVTKLSLLNEKAGNIAGVVKTINKIADQTNLLSLNAAIEAEKAGEYGAGFAVVASEIRRLADQTAVATFDIEQMVKEVQSAISSAVMGIDKFAEDTQQGADNVRQISEQLVGVIEQVQVLRPQVEVLTEGIEAQTQGAKQINEAIMQINEAAQQTAESLSQTSTTISHLQQAAAGLQDAIARFKTEKSNNRIASLRSNESWAADAGSSL